MKKLLFSLALLASSTLPAEDVPLGMTFTSASSNAAQSAAVLYGRQLNTNTLRQVAVDASGNLQTGASLSITSTVTTVDNQAYTSLSLTTVTLTTGAYSQNVTFAAGTSGTCQFCFSALGPSAGFYYAWSNSATPPTTFGAYYAVSTTPICVRDLSAGTYLHLTPTAAAASITARVNFMVKQ